MSCKTVQPDLVIALYGDLEPAASGRLGAHLDQCPDCRALLDDLGWVKEATTAGVVFPREAEIDWDAALTCRWFRQDLTLAAYGELSGDALDVLDLHLELCPDCSTRMQSIRALQSVVTPQAAFPRESEIDWARPLTCSVTLSLLGESSGRIGLDEDILTHVARCSTCADDAAVIHETLDLARDAFPEEEGVNWDQFARETARRAMAAERADTVVPLQAVSATGTRRRPAPTWLMPLAASLLAAVGLSLLYFGISAITPAPPEAGPVAANRSTPGLPPIAEPLPAGPPEVESMVASAQLLERMQVELAKSNTSRYLSDSRDLLLSFAELPVPCESKEIDISIEQQLSTRLLRRKQFLDRDLEDVEVARAGRLANEIEVLLADIQSLEKCASPEHIEAIRNRVRKGQVMMRIEMITTELDGPGGGRA